MSRAGSVGRGLVCGALTGLGLGGLEALERTAVHAPHLEGAGEIIGHALLTLAPIWLFCTLLGGVAGVVAAGLAVLGRAIARLPAGARRALLGAVLGLLAGGWLLFCLTLTARLGGWLRYTPLFLLGSSLLGTFGGLVSPHLREPWRRPAASLLVVAAVVTYFLNSRFAPQSSYGIHVLFDSAQWVTVMTALVLWRPPAHRMTRVAIAIGMLSCVVGMDIGFRASPRVEQLVKVRGVFARRALDAFRNALDFDRDGFAPHFLVHGWDEAPFDASRPGPLLVCESSTPLRDAASDSSPSPRARPNVLLLTVDACRDDVLPGAPGENPLAEAAVATPHLAELRRRSAAFARCYSHASGTEDTFASLFAGSYLPAVLCGVADGEFLAARLRAAGYRTRGWSNGFPMPSSAWGWPEIEVREGSTEPPIDSILAFLAAPAESARGPAFAWIHLMDLHASILKPWSPQAYDQAVQRRRYAAGLRSADETVGRLLGGLEGSGLWSNSLVILSADHGEELGEHGHYHHNLTLYEPAVRVPLWIAGWGVTPGPRGGQVRQMDVHATVLQAAGLDPATSAGRSLLPVLGDASALPAAQGIYLFLPTRGFSRSPAGIRPERGQASWIDPSGRYKTILRFDKETEEAYDLVEDPRERWNVAGQRPSWFAAGRDSLRRYLSLWKVGRR